MATLTEIQLVLLHDQLGTDADEIEMQERYDRNNDVNQVMLEMLQRRLADMVAAPACFSVSGEYTQSTGANIDAITAKISQIGSSLGVIASGRVRIVRPVDPASR